MTYLQAIINNLKQSPMILKGMLNDIPKNRLKVQRHEGKWCIHEHTCHLAQAESMIFERFKEFESNENPTFTPYLPGVNIDTDHLLDKNLHQELSRYESLRNQLVDLISTFEESLWL
ncbi:MAG: DinB family protein [Bacteroidota bacterium]